MKTGHYPRRRIVVALLAAHDHMQGFVVIGDASHRAVTDAYGRVSFDGLTSQPMQMSVWHPHLSSDHQQRQESVLTPAGQAETVALTLTVPPRSERTRSSLQQLFDRATE